MVSVISMKTGLERQFCWIALHFWLTICYYERDKEEAAYHQLLNEFIYLFEKQQREGFYFLIVSNETGMGIVPEYPLARTFRDLQGRVNQWLATKVNQVYLVVAGIPVKIKGEI